MRIPPARLGLLLTLATACAAPPIGGRPDASTGVDGGDDAASDSESATDSDIAADGSNEDGDGPTGDATIDDAGGPDSTGTDGGADSDVDGGTDENILGETNHPEEICGNEIDDDRNGSADDGCECPRVGFTRSCYTGPPATFNVGSCREGQQQCFSDGVSLTWTECRDSVTPGIEYLNTGEDEDCDGDTDESAGRCLPRQSVEMGAGCRNLIDDDCDGVIDCDEPECAGQPMCPRDCTPSEDNCVGNHDDDCDGFVDCRDSDCRLDPACMMTGCPEGQGPTYTQQNLGTSPGRAGSISRGNGRPQWELEECAETPCSPGQVFIQPNDEMGSCVEPPPDCPAGEFANYTRGGFWECGEPCVWQVHYGHLFDFENHCAGRPGLSCPGGQTPTFVYESREWECRTTCRNHWYDRIMVEGQLLCVPC